MAVRTAAFEGIRAKAHNGPGHQQGEIKTAPRSAGMMSSLEAIFTAQAMLIIGIIAVFFMVFIAPVGIWAALSRLADAHRDLAKALERQNGRNWPQTGAAVLEETTTNPPADGPSRSLQPAGLSGPAIIAAWAIAVGAAVTGLLIGRAL